MCHKLRQQNLNLHPEASASITPSYQSLPKSQARHLSLILKKAKAKCTFLLVLLAVIKYILREGKISIKYNMLSLKHLTVNKEI